MVDYYPAKVVIGLGWAVFFAGVFPAIAQSSIIPAACLPAEIAQSPRCLEALLSQGRDFTRQGDFAKALQLYQKAAQLSDRNPRIHSAIGFLHVHQHNYPAAIAAYQQAIALDPNNGRFHYALGFSLAHIGDNDGAERAYRRAIELNPYYPPAHLSLGIILTRKGLYRRALLSHGTALALQPDNPQIYEAIGAVYTELGQPSEAQLFFYRAGQLSRRPEQPPLRDREVMGYR